MTKKDYELIAETILLKLKDIEDARQIGYISEANNKHSYDTVCELAEDFADKFGLDNPKFDRNKFLQACGVENYKHRVNFDLKTEQWSGAIVKD